MKERQRTSTRGVNPQLKTKWSEAEKPEPTSQRKELAKIAGTSEGHYQNKRQVKEHMCILIA